MRICPLEYDINNNNNNTNNNDTNFNSNEHDSLKHEFELFSFELDHFQKYSIEAIYKGHHSLVTAHTGSGKTVPAEYAIQHFVKLGKKVIYTSPIKSLSNQKYYELSKSFPHISFGIFTGDIKFNPEADCVIMTTEILRNMLYHHSSSNVIVSTDQSFQLDINELACVIFDEVHYINDMSRGKVWEETIMMLPNHIQMVMLSATIDCIEEFASWIDSIKEKDIWISTTHKRVVPLFHYAYTCIPEKHIKQMVPEVPHVLDYNNKLMCIKNKDSTFQQTHIHKIDKIHHYLRKHHIKINDKFVLNRIIQKLKTESKLPAICFVFSRKKAETFAKYIETNLHDIIEEGYDDRTYQKRSSNVRQECVHILKTLNNNKDYIESPEFEFMISLLEKGIAVHHSGILPILREMIELLFSKGYIQLLFATETFSVGINMPTKTVLFTSLLKFDGIQERIMLPHEYIQMAGRAGRRGLDKVGHVIHLNDLFDKQTNTTCIHEYKQMLCGKPQKIVSKFNVDFHYFIRCLKMIINTNTNENDNTNIFNMNNMFQSIEHQIEHSMYYLNIQHDIKYYMNQQHLSKQHIDTFLEEHPFFQTHDFLNIWKELLNSYNTICHELDRLNHKRNKQYYKYYNQKITIETKWNSLNHLYSIDTISSLFQKYLTIQKEHLKLQDDFLLKQNEMSTNIKNIMDFMLQENYIQIHKDGHEDNEKILFTKKGICATSIQEINAFIFSELYINNYFNHLTVDDLIILFSCFTSLKIPEQNKVYHYHGTKEINQIFQNIDKIINTYYEKETELFQCVDEESYYYHFDLIEGIYDWIYAENDNACQEILKRYHEYGIMQGEFIKTILKIVAIANEIQEFCNLPSIQDIQLMNLCSQIPEKLMKNVATNQSLYVYTN